MFLKWTGKIQQMYSHPVLETIAVLFLPTAYIYLWRKVYKCETYSG